MRGRPLLELALLPEAKLRAQRFDQRHLRQVRAAGDSIQPWSEPGVERLRERGVRYRGPCGIRVGVAARGAAHELDARLQVTRVAAPGKRLDAELPHPCEHGAGPLFRRT